MAIISLYMMIGIFIYSIVNVLTAYDKGRAFVGTIFGWIFMYCLIYGLEYEGMAIQRVSSFMLCNAAALILYMLLSAGGNMIGSAVSGNDSNANPIALSVGSAIAVVCLIGCATIGISSNFNARRSATTIHVEKMKSKTAPTLHKDETPVGIAPSAVFTQVDNSMDQVPDSNQYEDSHEISAQWYHNKPVYIVPIQFRSFWQAMSMKYVPGYFRINATDPNASPVFVHKRMRYSDTLFLNHNMTRRMYSAHHDWVDLSNNPQLEIDNNKTPYYVATLFKPTATNNRPKFNNLKVVVGNAVTGKVKTYRNPNKTPKFIDENLTSDVADKINNYYGYYPKGHGWINAHVNQYGVKQPTEEGPEDGVTTVFGRDHSISYFSDFTSTQHDTHSALGYSMINARTGHMKYYHASGIDATKAKDVAEQSNTIHTNGWHADIPVPYEVQGHTTWVMSVLDSSDNQRGFFFINNKDTNASAYSSSSLDDCLSQYKQSLLNHVSSMKNTKASKKTKKTGKVDRVSITSGGTVIFNLQGHHTIYTISASKYPSAQLMKTGDSISFETGVNGTNSTATDFTDSTFNE